MLATFNIEKKLSTRHAQLFSRQQKNICKLLKKRKRDGNPIQRKMDSTMPSVINSVVSLLRNKERRELEFALHLNETAGRQQVQDKLVAIALKTGNSLVRRKRKTSSVGKTAVFSQSSRNTKIFVNDFCYGSNTVSGATCI